MKNYFILLLISTFLSYGMNDDTLPNKANQRDDNGITLNISLSGSLQNPAFSPNNKSIVFTRFINGYNKEPTEVYKFNLETEKLTLLVSDGSSNVNLPGSSWVNGNIIFASTREPHDEIYMIPEGGNSGDEIQITNREANVAYEPAFSPDGQWAVFESHKLNVETDGIITKYKIDKTSSYIKLTDANDDCRQPNWSPNGDKILYQKKETNQWNIWIMNTDGTSKFQVTSNLGNCTDASFSADGQFIVFSSDFQVDLANIYKISITGENPTKLTNYNGYDGATSISNDGKQLVFESVNRDPYESSGTKLILLKL